MIKDLVLIRHAHRDTDAGRLRDNGLSAKGRKQAEELVELYQRFFSNEEVLLLSSPYKRCRQTLEPLAEALGLELEIEKKLSEMQAEESSRAFEKRVCNFAEEWLEGESKLVLACSHGDFLPHLIQELSGTAIWLKKGAWVHLRQKEGEVSLENLIQRVNSVL